MHPLADAAKSRSEADWLVGINGTRAMTAFNSKGGGFFLTTVGRVQTPTLSIVVEREEKIKQFVPRDYWEVQAEFVAAAGVYPGRWFDPKFKRTDDDPHQRDSRLWSKAAADSIVAACRGKTGTVTEEAKPSTSMAPGAVRPDDAAARSERPLRLLGEEHARASRRRCTRGTRC